MLARSWPPGIVPELLARAGAVSTRPEGMGPEAGLLADGYRFSEEQAQAVLEMRLHRLTALEQSKIVEEFQWLLREIVDLSDILARPARLIEVVRYELIEIRDNYGDERRTEISRDHLNLSTEDLIGPQDVAVTHRRAGGVPLPPAGYARGRRCPASRARGPAGPAKPAPRLRAKDSSRS